MEYKIEQVNANIGNLTDEIIEQNGQMELLFEVRSANLHRQPGEVCFPGGAVEEEERFEDAAVHSYLGVLKPYNGTYSTEEVDRVFSVPLQWFMENEPEKYVAEIHTMPCEDFPFELVPGGKNYNWNKSHYDIYFYRYEKEIIWGITAKLMYAFVKLCRGERL